MKTWQIEDARTCFDELLEACSKEGPQVVTRRGEEVAMLVPIEQWRSLERRARPNLKDLLLAPEPRVEELTPSARAQRR